MSESICPNLNTGCVTKAKKAEVEKYIQGKLRRDAGIKTATTVGSIGLTVGALAAAPITGGSTIPLALSGLGTILGLSGSAYNFERAKDLNRVAQTSDAGGNQLLTDPEAAKQNYVFAWVDLALGLIDGGLAVREGGQVLKGAKAAEKILSDGGADAIARLTPEQTRKFQALATSTDDVQKQQLRQSLRQELGDANFDAANQVFEGSKLETISDAEAATIRGRGGLTPEQDAIADRMADEFAQTIIKKGKQANYKKNKTEFIRRQLDSGKLVEEIGESRVRDFYSDPNAEVWSNVYLQAKDAAGNNLGGQQSELDFFVHYTDGSSPTEIVSAKLDGKKVKPKTDYGHLSKFYDVNINGTQEELVLYLKNKFGNGTTKAYDSATNVFVKYTDVKTGKTGEIPLSDFRKKIPESSTTKVRGLAPDDTIIRKDRDIELGIGQEALLNRIISVIDSKI